MKKSTTVACLAVFTFIMISGFASILVDLAFLIVWFIVGFAGFLYVLHKVDAEETRAFEQNIKAEKENKELKEEVDLLERKLEKLMFESENN